MSSRTWPKNVMQLNNNRELRFDVGRAYDGPSLSQLRAKPKRVTISTSTYTCTCTHTHTYTHAHVNTLFGTQGRGTDSRTVADPWRTRGTVSRAPTSYGAWLVPVVPNHTCIPRVAQTYAHTHACIHCPWRCKAHLRTPIAPHTHTQTHAHTLPHTHKHASS